MSAEDDRPPVLKSWRRVYAFVLANLVLLIILFYSLSRIFS